MINGHDIDAVDRAFQEAIDTTDKPICILAETNKGHGASLTENKEGWHGKALSPEQADGAIKEIVDGVGGERPNLLIETKKPEDANLHVAPTGESQKVSFKVGDKVSSREAYGEALVAIGADDPLVVALDARSLEFDLFRKVQSRLSRPLFRDLHRRADDGFGCGGLAESPQKSLLLDLRRVSSRALSIRFAMGAISQANLKLVGTHAGVSIGEDGPSQMALEDIAMFRAVYGSTVLYPSDATSTAALVREMKDLPGIAFLRSTREKTPVLYDDQEEFPIGGSKTLRTSDNDAATIIAAGITLHEAIKAADELKEKGIAVRVIDLYSVKPIDVKTIAIAAQETRHLIVVEDHWCQGGLGDAVLVALADAQSEGTLDGEASKFTHLCVSKMPRSGKPMELLADNGIAAADIVKAVQG